MQRNFSASVVNCDYVESVGNLFSILSTSEQFSTLRPKVKPAQKNRRISPAALLLVVESFVSEFLVVFHAVLVLVQPYCKYAAVKRILSETCVRVLLEHPVVNRHRYASINCKLIDNVRDTPGFFQEIHRVEHNAFRLDVNRSHDLPAAFVYRKDIHVVGCNRNRYVLDLRICHFRSPICRVSRGIRSAFPFLWSYYTILS